MNKQKSKNIGKTFGFLTIINVSGSKKYKCRCICGKILDVYRSNLLSGKTKSCGCYNDKMRGITQFKDMTGQKFGRLTVISRSKHSCDEHASWLCRCDCGNTCVVNGRCLRQGSTQSCGCYQREMCKKWSTTHGETKTRLYHSWLNMKARCYNTNNHKYYRYGARGIYVCDEWKNDFVTFRDWSLSHGYNDDLTIDRIDNDGPYAPWNCRWTTSDTQANNKSSNVMITLNNITHDRTEWEHIMNFDEGRLRRRLNNGWTIYDALTIPNNIKHSNERYNYNGPRLDQDGLARDNEGFIVLLKKVQQIKDLVSIIETKSFLL